MRPLLLLSLLLTMFLGIAGAEDITVEGTGYGVSQNEAVIQAKRDALSKGIGQILISQTEVENYMVKKDVVLTKTMGNIKKFDILKEEKGPDGSWMVKLRAVVSKDGIEKDLAALMILREAVGNPRIAMLISETNIGNEDPTANKTEILLIDFFKERDFEVVDPSYALKFRESAEGVKAMAGDPEAAARLGQELNAEVMIVGTVVSKQSDVSQLKAFKNTAMKSASAQVSLKAVNVSTRRIMAAKTIDAPAVHVNVHTAGAKAMEKAVKKLMGKKGKFFDALVKSWQSTANDGGTFALSVSGVTSFKLNKAVKAALTAQVTKLDQRGFRKPKLKVDAIFSGSVDDLCERLDGLSIPGFKGKTLSVESYQGSAVSLSVQ